MSSVSSNARPTSHRHYRYDPYFAAVAVIAIMIKRDSTGPVFFRQERVGMDGRIFLCLKFRTMRADADDTVHRETYRQNIAGGSGREAAAMTKNLFMEKCRTIRE